MLSDQSRVNVPVSILPLSGVESVGKVGAVVSSITLNCLPVETNPSLTYTERVLVPSLPVRVRLPVNIPLSDHVSGLVTKSQVIL